jgi:two-component system cell cycle sensor histidine kinase/response regulator CckA
MIAQNLPEMTSAESVDMQRKRILILEDDAEFNAILQQYLESEEYEVVAVPNGAEGIREILAGDFEAIVCDIMMPNLPGDMFYLAVERMRPHLCSRFIFITGYNDNVKVAEFIDRIEGTVLKKPFHVDDLIDLISFFSLRTAIALPA